MTFLNEFFTSQDESQLSVSAEQGSRFAKLVADDFNPIHDADSRRFCVPGDLLFAIALSKYGIHQTMDFRFLDLLNADMPVIYPKQAASEMVINNAKGKPTLGIHLSGEQVSGEQQMETLIRNYVAFSGHNFPDILIPLMREHGVMINPQRPLVIYESMSLQFDTLDFTSLRLELTNTALDVAGKRGEAKLSFTLYQQGQEKIGTGVKTLILSGLREYEEDAIQAMRDQYAQSKQRRAA